MGNCKSLSQAVAENAALKARIADQDRKLIEQNKQLGKQIDKNREQGKKILEMEVMDEQMKRMLMAIAIPILDAAAARKGSE